MKASDIRQMEDAEIRSKLEDAKEEMFNLRIQRAAGKLEDLTRMKVLRRDIARYLTALRQREIAAALVNRPEEGHAE